MNRYITFTFFLIISNYVYSQNDSTKVYDPDYWTPRFAIGIQESPFIEIGISRLMIHSHDIVFGSVCLYGSLELNRRNNVNPNFFYGTKVGFENSFGLLMWGIETKYITDFHDNRFLITPKVGLSFLGVFSVLYGYNYPKKLGDFEGLGHHQFSMIININRRIYTDELKYN